MRPLPDSQSILLIRLKSIGDIIFTLPAVNVMRAAFPGARLSYLVSKEYAGLLEGFGDLDEVIPLDRDAYRGLNPVRILRETGSLLRRLRRSRFSLAVDLHGNGETAMLTWYSGASRRWGEVYRPGRRWAYTHGIPRDDEVHPAQSHLLFLKRCGLTSGPARNAFVLPARAREEAEEFFRQQKLDPARPTLFIQPFTSGAHKNWPLENFRELGLGWRKRGLQVLFGGGPAESAALEPIRQAGFPVSAGVPLLTSAGLMQLSSVVIGGDTGLLHLAVALGKRVVMLLWSAGVGSNPPYEHSDWAIVPPEGQTVSRISVETVDREIARALGG